MVQGVGAVLLITCFYTAWIHQNTALLWQREGVLSEASLQRANLQVNNYKHTWKGESITVLSSEAQLLQQLSTAAAISSQVRGAAGHEHCPGARGERHRALGLNPPLCLPGIGIYYLFSLLTSHWSWHSMSTAFRNRMWDTRRSVYVLFMITKSVYRKPHMDAVSEFQWRPWVWFCFFFPLRFWTGSIRQACDFAQRCTVSFWVQSQHISWALLVLHHVLSLRIGYHLCSLLSTSCLEPALMPYHCNWEQLHPSGLTKVWGWGALLMGQVL